MSVSEIPCPYCGGVALHVSGDVIYPHRPDLSSLGFYLCQPCNAYVGCHKGTLKPLGTPAKAELRKLRSSCHEKFDKLWREVGNGNRARTQAYSMLSAILGVEELHFGSSNEELATRALSILESMTSMKDLQDTYLRLKSHELPQAR